MKQARDDTNPRENCGTASHLGGVASIPDIDIDRITGVSTSVDADYYGNIFGEELKHYSVTDAEYHILAMMRNIMRMVVPTEAHRLPIEPKVRFSTGARFAALDDFGGSRIDIIKFYAEKTSNITVKSRLSHLVWLLDPKQRDMAKDALDLYITMLKRLVNSRSNRANLTTDFDTRVREFLCLAYGIVSDGKSSDTDIDGLNSIMLRILNVFCKSEKAISFLQIIEVAIGRSRIDPKRILNALAGYIKKCGSDIDLKYHADIWRLAGAAQDLIEKDERWLDFKRKEGSIYMQLYEKCIGRKSDRSKIEASRWLVFMINNILNRNDNPAKYLEYCDLFYSIGDDVQSELKKIYTSYTEEAYTSAAKLNAEEMTLSRALLIFTIFERIPDPGTLLEQAKRIVDICPVFGFLDSPHHISKEPYNTSTCNESSKGSAEISYNAQIFHIENIRRRTSVRDKIEFYRSGIGHEFRPSTFVVRELLKHSPVVPLRSVDVISDGFARYFQGDMISAFYILVPHIEGILREALRACGYSATVLQNHNRPSKERSLSSILRSMRTEVESIFGSAVLTDIERVFDLKNGPRIKHGVAHARFNDSIPFDADANYACWLIWHVVALPLVPRWNEVMPDI